MKEVEIIFIEELNIPKTFLKKPEQTEELIEVCGICSNCCFTDCVGGN